MTKCLTYLLPFICAGCAVHRDPLLPPVRPGDAFITSGTITGIRNLTLLSSDAMIDATGKCAQSLCIGPPDADLIVKDIEVYLTTVDGHKTIVVHPAKPKKHRARR